MVTLLPVESSMIAAAGYDPAGQTLYVLFNTGTVYEYYRVPQEKFDQLMAAESKGHFMQENILKQHEYAIFSGWKKK